MMDVSSLLLQLFTTFFIIGLFTFGGGYAIMSLIQSQVVFSKEWISESTFTNIVAISQVTPGPVGLNCSTYVGYEVMQSAGFNHLFGILGSFTASMAVILPSFLVVLILARIYSKFHETSIFQGVMNSIKPAVAGMIGAASLGLILRISLQGAVPEISLLRDNFPDWKSWIIFAGAFAASVCEKASPFILLGAAGILGLLLY